MLGWELILNPLLTGVCMGGGQLNSLPPQLDSDMRAPPFVAIYFNQGRYGEEKGGGGDVIKTVEFHMAALEPRMEDSKIRCDQVCVCARAHEHVLWGWHSAVWPSSGTRSLICSSGAWSPCPRAASDSEYLVICSVQKSFYRPDGLTARGSQSLLCNVAPLYCSGKR